MLGVGDMQAVIGRENNAWTNRYCLYYSTLSMCYTEFTNSFTAKRTVPERYYKRGIRATQRFSQYILSRSFLRGGGFNRDADVGG
jgi:hypothetical protein